MIEESTFNGLLQICTELEALRGELADSDVADHVIKCVKSAKEEWTSKDVSWSSLATFWPPRAIESFSKPSKGIGSRAAVFFGAGVSVSSGLPGWRSLLRDVCQIDESLVDDEDLQNDPLTLAELAGQAIGSEKLQSQLRSVFNARRQASTAHFLLSSLGSNVYISTNYDRLFEEAFNRINQTEIQVVTNDADVTLAKGCLDPSSEKPVLFKLHGCAGRPDEHLILTRRDYRRHYRQNRKFFQLVESILLERQALFVGFSHRDPEVSRLIEDAIHRYESEKRSEPKQWSQLYSLQFNMKNHTPEVFAARGIVALRPPAVVKPSADSSSRSFALAEALTDLLLAQELGLHAGEEPRIESRLSQAVSNIEKAVDDGLSALGRADESGRKRLDGKAEDDWLLQLRDQLGDLASQGVFLADSSGSIVAGDAGDQHDTARLELLMKKGVRERPYFQEAKTFRRAFVSDATASMFNGNSTIFLCCPLLEDARLVGLLFSATQLGQWREPLEIARSFWDSRLSFMLIDGNGVCLLPPQREFEPLDRPWPESSHETGIEANSGYEYRRLLEISRRDRLVSHIAQSVVPVEQDDDVFVISGDCRYYTVVSELASSRWKLAVSKLL